MKRFAVAFVGVLLAFPAFAQSGTMAGSGAILSDNGGNDDANQNANSTGGQAPNGERLVCRRIDTDSASHMATRRVCHTQAEWRAIERSR